MIENAMPFNFKKYKSILCLNGELPEKHFFEVKLPIIAADGATNQLMAMGIKPNLIIGDLDSVSPDYLEHIQNIQHWDQDYCDYQKSLWYLEKNDLLPAIIVGVNGGYLDHILNNINLFMAHQNLLYSPPIYGFVLNSQQNIVLNLPINTKVSLLGIPSAKVSTVGFKWELNLMDLSFPGKTSCFNRTSSCEPLINVQDGSALVLVYMDSYK